MSNIKEILNSEAGKELKGYLLVKYNELKNISNVKDCKLASAQAVELKAQKKAAEKLREILEKIMTLVETEAIDKEQDQYFNL